MRDDRGQMMMLTAIVLLAAFLALSATVAQVNTLAAQTARERTDPFPSEFIGVQSGIERIALQLDNTTKLNGRDYTDMLDGALRDLAAVEASRGYVLRATATCNGVDVDLNLELQDARNYAAAAWTLDLPEDNCS